MKLIHFAKRHKKRFLLILIPVIVLVVIFWPKSPKKIETHKVESGEIVESLTASGTVNSVSSVNLSFISGGKLVYLGAKKGDIVEAGQIIASLDQRSTQKNLETALRNYSLQRNTFEQTKDDQNDHTPQDALTDKMKRILENNQYDLEKATISVELQQLAKEQSILIAPISGILTRADAGTTGVNITATTTFSIADPINLVLEIDIDEADIGKIKIGQPVKVTFDTYPNDVLELTITEIDFASHQSSTGSTVYTVQAAMPPNEGTKYRMGMNGDAEIILAKKYDVLTVSLASITDDNAVYIKKDNWFVKKKVTTGLQSDTEIEIISGVEKGDEVALQPDEAAKHIKKEGQKRFLIF